MKAISVLRKEIDSLDNEIISLLENRLNISRKIGEYKKANHLEVLDTKREEEILKKICNKIDNKNYQNSIIEIYKTIFLESKKLQF